MTRDTFDRFQPQDRGMFGDNEQYRPRGRVTGASNLVDVMLVRHHATERALLASSNGEEARAVWLPLASIEIVDTGKIAKGTRKNGQVVSLAVLEVTLPQWLAREKGVV